MGQGRRDRAECRRPHGGRVWTVVRGGPRGRAPRDARGAGREVTTAIPRSVKTKRIACPCVTFYNIHYDSASTGAYRGRSPLYLTQRLSLSLAGRRVALLRAPFLFEMLDCGIVSSRASIVAGHRGENTTDEVRPVARVRPHATWALCGTSRPQLARCMLVGHGSLERICDEPSYLRSGPCLLVIAAPKLLWVLKAAAAGGSASLACASRRTVPPAQRQVLRCRWGVRLAREASLHEPPAAFWCMRNRGGTPR